MKSLQFANRLAMSLPKTMRAYKCMGPKKAAAVEVPLPAERPDYVLVKVSHVALNPTDWKHIDSVPTEGATVGCDFSGTVVSVGPEVQKPFRPGDRIAGFTHGVNKVQPEDGCFGEYCVAKGDTQLMVPPSLPDAEAATLGVAIATIGQGLYQSLGLPLPTAPTKDKTWILIYGASSAMGLMACQFARLSGFVPVATCSPRNFKLVESYGAEAAFDYNDADCAAKIHEHTGGKIAHAFDCISEKNTAEICGNAMSSNGGAYCSLLPIKVPRDNVKSERILAYTVTGEYFKFREGVEYPPKPEDFEFAVEFFQITEQLLKDRKLKALPVDKREGGLDKIADGLDDLRQGRVSGRKIVYQI